MGLRFYNTLLLMTLAFAPKSLPKYSDLKYIIDKLQKEVGIYKGPKSDELYWACCFFVGPARYAT